MITSKRKGKFPSRTNSRYIYKIRVARALPLIHSGVKNSQCAEHRRMARELSGLINIPSFTSLGIQKNP